MILVLITLYGIREDSDEPVQIFSLARASAAHTREVGNRNIHEFGL